MGEIKNYKDLRIWKQGIEIVKQVYQRTKIFPKSETYGLSSQMQRAAVSIPSNIAEGHNRLHQREFQQFLNIALGSCAELETQIIIAGELQYLDKNATDGMLNSLDSEAKQIRALLKMVVEN
jgi:four helix bundle protein